MRHRDYALIGRLHINQPGFLPNAPSLQRHKEEATLEAVYLNVETSKSNVGVGRC